MKTTRSMFKGLVVMAVCLSTPVVSLAEQGNTIDPMNSLRIWSARWWQWALNKTVATSPLLGPTAENPTRPYCEASGIGAVWFLSGSLGYEGPLLRECTIPAGARLLFPVATSFFVRDPFLLEAYGRWPLKESKDVVRVSVDGATEVFVRIDGTTVPLSSNRVESAAFPIVLPPGHIYEQYGYPAGIYTPAVADGYWLMLPPLSPGKHTVYFHAVFASGEVIDVTYTILVAGA